MSTATCSLTVANVTAGKAEGRGLGGWGGGGGGGFGEGIWGKGNAEGGGGGGAEGGRGEEEWGQWAVIKELKCDFISMSTGFTPCIRVPKFSAGASRYSEAQSEQAEAKR